MGIVISPEVLVEGRLVREMRTLKERRKDLMQAPPSPANDREQDQWEDDAMTVVRMYCDGTL